MYIVYALTSDLEVVLMSLGSSEDEAQDRAVAKCAPDFAPMPESWDELVIAHNAEGAELHCDHLTD